MIAVLAWAALAAPDREPAQLRLDAHGPGPTAATAHGGPADVQGLGPGGGVLSKTLVHDGVPVHPALRLHVDAVGRMTPIGVWPRPGPFTEGAVIGAHEAIGAALAQGLVQQATAHLSWRQRAGIYRPVWTVDARRSPPGSGFVAAVVYVDGLTGRVLGTHEGAHAARPAPVASAYLNNPMVDEAPVEVTLPLAVDGLRDDRVETVQCRDLGEEVPLWVGGVWLDEHVCTWVAVEAVPDGDYRTEPVPYPDDPGDDEDAFAAPHTYWNVHRALSWFDELGWQGASDVDPFVQIVVNQRFADPWSPFTLGGTFSFLQPFDNAYFGGMTTDEDGSWVPGYLVFGQGWDADYAYDSDVIVHEVGHLVFRTLHGPRESAPSPFGPTRDAAAINEGLADYWSSAVQGDPALGEYAADDSRGLRGLDGDRSCPQDFAAQAHGDGLILAQALWEVRQGLGPLMRPAFDRAVLDSISRMAEPISFAVASAALVAQTELGVGTEAATVLSDALERRGLFACEPVIAVVPGPDAIRGKLQHGAALDGGQVGSMPGFVQLRVEVPAGGHTYTLRFDQHEFLGLDLNGDGPPQPLGVVGQRDAPLSWHLQPSTSGTADAWAHDGRWLALAALDGVEPLGDGRTDVHHFSATLTLEAGTWLLQLTNPAPRWATLYDLILTGSERVPLAPQSTRPVSQTRGCGGCQTGSVSPGLGLLRWLTRRRTR